MNESDTTDAPRFPWRNWAVTNIVLIILGFAAWAWIDWRYVTDLWMPEDMIKANGILAWALPIAALFIQYIVLRRQSPGRQTAGALGGAILVIAAWWTLLLTVGAWFHVEIGGTLD